MRYVMTLAVAATLLPQPARAEEPDEALARQLAAVVRDPRLPVLSRIEAAKTLGKLGSRAAVTVPDIVAVLERLRGQEQEPLQEALVDALGQMGTPAKAALPALARATARSVDIDQAIKRTTAQLLIASDAQDLDALTRQLTSRDPSLRLRAVKGLSTFGVTAQPVTENLAALLTDADADVRRATIAALRVIQPNVRPPEVLLRAIAVDLSDPDPNVRLLAVRSLGRIGAPAGAVATDIDALRNDPDPDVRRAVVDALTRIAAAP